jgi:hypothetical protein
MWWVKRKFIIKRGEAEGKNAVVDGGERAIRANTLPWKLYMLFGTFGMRGT